MFRRKDTALDRGCSLALGMPRLTEGGLGLEGPCVEENVSLWRGLWSGEEKQPSPREEVWPRGSSSVRDGYSLGGRGARTVPCGGALA